MSFTDALRDILVDLDVCDTVGHVRECVIISIGRHGEGDMSVWLLKKISDRGQVRLSRLPCQEERKVEKACERLGDDEGWSG